MSEPRIAVAGCGYWGKNLVRTMAELGALEAVCDHDSGIAESFAEQYRCRALSWGDVLKDRLIDAVVIATPAALHRTMAIEALEAGKHIYVEKPLALTASEAEEIVKASANANRLCMVGHLLQYHRAFVHLRSMVENGELGKLRYVYSNRLNLGKFRREEDSLWSFAPHDISMILALVGEEPVVVTAVGNAYLRADIADVTMTNLQFANGVAGHVFVSWLHPHKEQTLVVVGEKSMAVFNDTLPWEKKLALYDHNVLWKDGNAVPERADARFVMLERSEPLRDECQHFLDSVSDRTAPKTDGAEALRVLRVLERATESMAEESGRGSTARTVGALPGVHETVIVDEGVTVGERTKIWHFSHILRNSRIGRDCSLGQNVVVGPDVTIGDKCKIQNNVSVYNGVTLEDEVFCGPSMVFTNVNNPRAAIERKDEFAPTLVRKGATIGANATVVCGTTLGEYCFIAAGATVTSDVPAYALVAGTPARRVGWVSAAGRRLGDDLVCPDTGEAYELTDDGFLELKER